MSSGEPLSIAFNEDTQSFQKTKAAPSLDYTLKLTEMATASKKSESVFIDFE